MLNEVSSRKDTFIVNILKTIQMLLIFLVIVVCVFWVLQLAGVPLNKDLQDFAASLLAIGDMIYGESIRIYSYDLDFSYLSTVAVLAAIYYVLSLIVYFIKNQEEQFQIRKNKRKKIDENKVNKELETSLMMEELKYKNCILLLSFNILSAKKGWNSEEKQEITIDELINKFIKELEANNVSLNVAQKAGKLLLEFDNVSQIDMKLNILSIILKNFQSNLSSTTCDISWCLAVDVYKNICEKQDKISRLNDAIDVASIVGIICFNSLKYRYELNQNRKYTLVSQGVYNVQDEDLEIFTLKKI